MLRAALTVCLLALTGCGSSVDTTVPAAIREGVGTVTEAANDGDTAALRTALAELTSDVKTARDAGRLTGAQATSVLDAAGRLAAGLPKPTPKASPSPSTKPVQRTVAPAPPSELGKDGDDRGKGSGKGKGGKDD